MTASGHTRLCSTPCSAFTDGRPCTVRLHCVPVFKQAVQKISKTTANVGKTVQNCGKSL